MVPKKKPPVAVEHKGPRDATYQRAEDARLRNSDPFPFAKGPSIGAVLDQYHAEHSHRRKAATYCITETMTQWLRCNYIDEGFPLIAIQKSHFQVYKTARLNGTATANKKKPGPVTIARKLAAIHHFIKWCVNNDHIESDLMSGVSLPPRLVSSAKISKEAFSDEEIVRILTAVCPYRKHKDRMRIEWAWSVILLAHSGCRAKEVVQLLKTDVRQIEGLWCMDLVGEAEGKTLKNKDSWRKVPLHSNALKSGFLEWHSKQKGPRLFHLLHPYGAMKVSKWSSDLLIRLGIKRPEVSLHSFRSAFAVALEVAEVHPSLAYRLMGHRLPGGVHATSYLRSLKYAMKKLSAEGVEKVKMMELPE